MMNRKWTVLASTMAGIAVAFTLMASISVADDDKENPVHKLMEKINKTHNGLRKAVNTQVAYKKAGTKQLIDDAEVLLKFSKETRDFTEPAKERKKEQKEWTEATDVMTKATQEFIEVLKADKGQMEAKKAYQPVIKSCADCHAIFKVDEDF